MNLPNPRSILKGIAASVLATAVVAMFLAVVWSWRNSRGWIDKCRQIGPEQLEVLEDLFNARSVYEPEATSEGTVRFRFDIEIRDETQTVFVIFSHRLRKPVYRGPYSQEISVVFDATLAGDSAFDILEFSLVRREENQLCRWFHDRGYPYWQADAEISIDLLPRARFDDWTWLGDYAVCIIR